MKPGALTPNLHSGSTTPWKEEFKPEVKKELTGKGAEPWEMIHFNSTRVRFRSPLRHDLLHTLVIRHA
jgi:hypothetical protein